MAKANPLERRRTERAILEVVVSLLGNVRERPFLSFFVILVLLLGLSWFPDAFWEVLRGFWTESPNRGEALARAFVALVALAVPFFWAVCWKRKVRPGVGVSAREASRVPYLLLFLSPLREEVLGRLREALEAGETEEEFKKRVGGSPWEVPLVALEYHKPRLRRVYVVTSEKSRGQFELFTRLVQALYPGVEVRAHPSRSLDFEEMEEVARAVEELYRDLEKEKISPKDLLVDVTGGQKTNSIAAALVTLARGRRFQYVSTQDKTVKEYDLEYFGES